MKGSFQQPEIKEPDEVQIEDLDNPAEIVASPVNSAPNYRFQNEQISNKLSKRYTNQQRKGSTGG